MPEPAWRHEGTEPDYRFTLANERTFLAWIRTALALLAGGVLLHQFAWTRTALAIAVNALLSIRAGFVAGEPLLVALGVLLFAASGAVVAIGTVRRRQLSGDRVAITPPAGALLGVAAATLVASAGGVASVFVGGVA